jgi:ABC-type multidrug transport system fused ATPase/permease subunit
MRLKTDPGSFLGIALRVLTEAQRRQGIWLVALMCLATLFETASVGAVIPVMSVLMNPDAGTFTEWLPTWARVAMPDSRTWLVAITLCGFLTVFASKSVVLLLLAWWQTRFVTDVYGSVSARLFLAYLHKPWAFHLQTNSGQLVSTAIHLANDFAVACGSVLNLLAESLVCVAIGGLLLVIEPFGAITAFATFASATLIFQRLASLRLKSWSEQRVRQDHARMKHLVQGLGAIKQLKLAGKEQHFAEQFAHSSREWNRLWHRQLFLVGVPRVWYELTAIFAVVTLALSLMARQEPLAEILPRIGLFAAAAFRLLPSATRLLASVQTMRTAEPAARQIDVDLSDANVALAASKAGDTDQIDADIVLQGVAFTYPEADQPAVDGVDMVVARGTTVGIIGESGSGKSTLTDLILGLIEPQAGTIFIGGQAISTILPAWQRSIGYVPQSIYLLDDTIASNIAFGLPAEEIDQAAAERAASAAQLDNLLTTLPAGMETVVGEQGVRLSGGQRQRIGIARALYHNPSVLILDEATSALDVQTERSLMRAINALHGQKTIVIVTHRHSTVSACDRIYQFERGKCVASGTPEELLPAQVVPGE